MRQAGMAVLALFFLGLAPVAAQQAKSDPASAQARRADIEAYRKGVFDRDKSYAAAARAEAERRLARLEAEAGSVSQAYFELELARITALADNGHSNAAPGPRSRRYDRIGLRLVPFGEDFYVLRAIGEQADLLGARLVAIDGKDVADARAAARSLIGGTPAWRDRNAGYLLESPEQMHALGLARSSGRATYRFRLADGRMVERSIVAEPANPDRPRANAGRWLYPAPVTGEDAAWRALLSPEHAPWALRDPDTPFRTRDAPEIDAFVIELRQIASSDKADIGEFLTSAAAAFGASGRRHLILDLRQNGGGNLQVAHGFVTGLAAKVPGRIFALTSPWTFSAAISSLGYLKQAAPDKVTIVGETVGDRLVFFAEGTAVTLPHSGAVITFSTERHDYQNGCRRFTDCHPPVVRYPIALRSLAPDLPAPWTIEAYRAGRDPAMDAIAAALRRS